MNTAPKPALRHFSLKAFVALLLSVQLIVLPLLCVPKKAYAQTATSHKITASASHMNRYTNGVLDDQYTESILGVNGQLAFCVNPYKVFKAGTVTSTSILTIMNQQTLTKNALFVHYMLNVYNAVNLPYNARVLMAQCLIWQNMYPNRYYEVWSAEEGGAFPELTKQVRESALASARQFVNNESWKYEGSGTLWQNGQTQDVATFEVKSIVGRLDLLKESTSPEITDEHPLYSREGAHYGVFTDAACTTLATTLVTNAQGYAISGELARGLYYVKETVAPAGFALDTQIYTVAVAAGTTTRLNGSKVYDRPLYSTPFLEISKYDAESAWSTANKPSAAASLKGAQYRVDYYQQIFDQTDEAHASGAPHKSWVFATDESGRCDLSSASPISGDPLSRNGSGKNLFPLGTYVIAEATPPLGYLPSNNTYVVQARQNGNAVELTGDTSIHDGHTLVKDAELIKRGDLAFNKVRESDMVRLAHIPFTLTSETTGERHVLVTDENGCVNTSAGWNKHSFHTNENDRALSEDGSVNEGLLNSEYGVWFRGNAGDETSAVDDTRGALPYDSYTLEELPCSRNKNLTLVKLEGLRISRDSTPVDVGTMLDSSEQSVSITTAAREAHAGGKTSFAGARTEIIDKVSYTNAIIGEEYELHGTLYHKESGQPLTGEDGNAIEQHVRFTPTASSGYVELAFTFDARSCAGSDVVVYEKLFKDGVLVASHEDSNDFDQTVTISMPALETCAHDGADGDKDVTANAASRITDTVTYANVVPHSSYELRGQIIDQETKECLGTATTSFTAGKSSGSVAVEFELDTTELVGRKLVLFEALYADGVLVASHEDSEDPAQTVTVVSLEISTLALDFADNNKVVMADTEAVIKDVVTYQNAMVGKTYHVVGKLMDPDTKRAIMVAAKDKEVPVEAEAEFTATSGTGQVELTYRFDARGLEGTRATSFVYLSEVADDVLGDIVCEETDYACEDQTVEFVTSKIKSFATDATDSDKLLLNSKSAAVTDKISYTNLIPGKEYMLVGKLIDKQTKDVLYVKDKPVTTTTTFTPNNPTGTVDVRFEFDASEIGQKELVVHEYLYRDMQIGDGDSKSVLVAAHEDIDDANQTVTFSTMPKRATPIGSLAKTGDDSLPLLTLFALVGSLGIVTSIMLWKKGRLSRHRETHDLR